jgi:hypothetical protein
MQQQVLEVAAAAAAAAAEKHTEPVYRDAVFAHSILSFALPHPACMSWGQRHTNTQ